MNKKTKNTLILLFLISFLFTVFNTKITYANTYTSVSSNVYKDSEIQLNMELINQWNSKVNTNDFSAMTKLIVKHPELEDMLYVSSKNPKEIFTNYNNLRIISSGRRFFAMLKEDIKTMHVKDSISIMEMFLNKKHISPYMMLLISSTGSITYTTEELINNSSIQDIMPDIIYLACCLGLTDYYDTYAYTAYDRVKYIEHVLGGTNMLNYEKLNRANVFLNNLNPFLIKSGKPIG